MKALPTIILAVMSITTAASTHAQTYSPLYEFTPTDTSQLPNGLISGPKGILFGTSISSSTGDSTVFEMVAPTVAGGAWTENTIYDISQATDGFDPRRILYTPGSLYVAVNDGPNDTCFLGCGSIFGLAAPTSPGDPWTRFSVHVFNGGTDGAFPASLIEGPNGTLYGTTTLGGGSSVCLVESVEVGCGTVFQLTPPAVSGDSWTETVLYAFAGGSDSGEPGSLHLQANGELIGTTSGGTVTGDFGTTYTLTPATQPGGSWTKTILFSFKGGLQGGSPVGSLVFGKNGDIYGTTAVGGSKGVGVAYVLVPPASPGAVWSEGILHTFQGENDGSHPEGLIAGPNGQLFGSTLGVGGSEPDDGTDFVLTPPAAPGDGWTETVLYLFNNLAFGSGPAGLLLGPNQTLYGVTTYGGSPREGVFYNLTY